MAALTAHGLTLEIGFHDLQWEEGGARPHAVIYCSIWLNVGGVPLLNEDSLRRGAYSGMRPIDGKPGALVAADWNECGILQVLEQALTTVESGGWHSWLALGENISLAVGTDILAPYLVTPPLTEHESDAIQHLVLKETGHDVDENVHWLTVRNALQELFDVVLMIDTDNFRGFGPSENGLILRFTPTRSALQQFHDDLQAEYDDLKARHRRES